MSKSRYAVESQYRSPMPWVANGVHTVLVYIFQEEWTSET